MYRVPSLTTFGNVTQHPSFLTVYYALAHKWFKVPSQGCPLIFGSVVFEGFPPREICITVNSAIKSSWLVVRNYTTSSLPPMEGHRAITTVSTVALKHRSFTDRFKKKRPWTADSPQDLKRIGHQTRFCGWICPSHGEISNSHVSFTFTVVKNHRWVSLEPLGAKSRFVT